MYETLIRPHEVNQIPTPLPIGEVSEKLKKAEQKREEKRLRQIANARTNPSGKRKRGDAEIVEAAAEDTGNKRVKTDDEDEAGSRTEGEKTANRDFAEPIQVSSSSAIQSTTDNYISTSKINLSKAMPEVRGHTSYLTFACLVPAMPVVSSETAMNIDNTVVNGVSSRNVQAKSYLTDIMHRIHHEPD
jgi:tRNA (adenine57-N1/adenine58-N1)-methyltransferase catalytic subunit